MRRDLLGHGPALLARRALAGGEEEPAVVAQLVDRLQDVGQGPMSAVLVGGVEEGARVPALGELLDRGHVHDPVVQVVDELGHVSHQEGLVGAHRVAGQLGRAGLGHERPDVLHHHALGLGQGQPLLELVEQSGRGVHLAHEVAHLLQGRRRGPDEHVDALPEGPQVVVGDDDRHLDERIDAQVEAGHLAVDPHQRVSGRHLSVHAGRV